MGKYMYYLSSTLVKKKGIWITAVIGIISVFLMTYVEIKDANTQNFNKINNLATFDFFLPFIFASLMSTFFVIHAFKSGEHDGTELLVVAKPLTRSQIIFGKFFVVIIAQILYQIILLPMYSALGVLDSVATNSQKIKYILSFTIGGLIVQIFMIGLITIFASLVGRIGTIVISIMFASIIPIASFIAAPVTGAYDVTNSVSKRYAYNYQFLKSLDPNDVKNQENVKLIYGNDDIANFNKADEKNKYKTVAFFDPWYQWSRFFTLFIDKTVLNGDPTGILKKYDKQNLKLNPDDFKISIHMKSVTGEDLYYVAFKRTSIGNNDLSNSKTLKEYISESMRKISDTDVDTIAKAFNDDLDAGTINTSVSSKVVHNKTDFKKLPLSERLTSLKDYFRNKTFTGITNNFDLKNLNVLRIMKKINQIDPDLINITKAFDPDRVYFNKDSISIERIKNLNKAIKPISKDYVDTSIVIVIWSSIGVLLMALSILLYFKRDFK